MKQYFYTMTDAIEHFTRIADYIRTHNLPVAFSQQIRGNDYRVLNASLFIEDATLTFAIGNDLTIISTPQSTSLTNVYLPVGYIHPLNALYHVIQSKIWGVSHRYPTLPPYQP